MHMELVMGSQLWRLVYTKEDASLLRDMLGHSVQCWCIDNLFVQYRLLLDIKGTLPYKCADSRLYMAPPRTLAGPSDAESLLIRQMQLNIMCRSGHCAVNTPTW